MTDFLSRCPLPPIYNHRHHHIHHQNHFQSCKTKSCHTIVKDPYHGSHVCRTGRFSTWSLTEELPLHEGGLAPCGRDLRAFLTLTVPFTPFVFSLHKHLFFGMAMDGSARGRNSVDHVCLSRQWWLWLRPCIRDDILCGQDCICCICGNSDNDFCTCAPLWWWPCVWSLRFGPRLW